MTRIINILTLLLILAMLEPPRASAQCTTAPWGYQGGGATAVVSCGSSRALVGMGTHLDLVTTPTTGSPASVTTSELGSPIKKIMGIGSIAWISTPTSIFCYDRLTTPPALAMAASRSTTCSST